VNIRGTATGFCFNAGRLFTATAVLFIGILVSALDGYGNSLFIFSLVFVVGLIATWFAKDKADDSKSALPINNLLTDESIAT
jgi:cyanate permease